ncbi:type II CAAX endopeptidase family protein [Natrinema sp. 1APR25-10V2]|uniref:CPBP family intramembrane glutamic endopeptidase n=1 Tax=Natrinema sp. 1APR25-10V2 TaxID=2951081 RepID=UPI0028766F6D|nr:type II CAAX endopeptidase family protein [Natrinema sp. 1APR25-10V2]MDS0477210.1 CPBP family intramembrane metalloprotease [Natrinema sp. 1APR25-10V2]
MSERGSTRERTDYRLDGSTVDARKVAAFVALAFGISWTAAAVLYLVGVEYNTIASTVLVVVFFMWAPAVAAVAVQLWYEEPIRAGTGLVRGRLRWSVLAWLAPVALLAATIGIGVALPSVSFTTDYGAFLAEQGFSEEQIEQSLATLEALPVPPLVLFVVQGLVAGVTINAVAALGEELGWRGLLLTELSPLGFWQLSGVTGVVWGVWHAPIILQGHNFPEAPIAGVVTMTVWTIAASPVFTYLTVRARSVLAATFFHGSFNAVGSFSLVYLTGAGNLLTAAVGVAGIGAAVVAVVACVVHDRYFADEQITTGDPLSPWA